jgi:hypothetical protein
MVKNLLCVGVAALAAALSLQAHATTASLPADQLWHSFDVDDTVAAGGSLGWIDIADNSFLSFTFTLAVPAFIKIVDGGFAGDVFQVSDNGVVLGTTSPATDTFAIDFSLPATQAGFDSAFADARFSSGTFLLAAGSHDITGLLSSSTAPFNITVGAVMIAAVPEPATSLIFLAGVGLLGGILARRPRSI